jgi:hypothetical protein
MHHAEQHVCGEHHHGHHRAQRETLPMHQQIENDQAQSLDHRHDRRGERQPARVHPGVRHQQHRRAGWQDHDEAEHVDDPLLIGSEQRVAQLGERTARQRQDQNHAHRRQHAVLDALARMLDVPVAVLTLDRLGKRQRRQQASDALTERPALF